ncbi:Carboxymethylenebutenolidase [Serratia liquefaciens]|nr:Carboxymethylenebutenolidase [Serratia liquefaciens]
MTTTKQPGFAPAASPHAATAVHTPEEHIIAGETSIPSQGENMPAYHARPKNADGPLPIVIVVQEIFGVHEHIRDLCRRLAQEGYLAIAPELYFRQGDPNEYHDIPTLFKELVSKVPDAQVLADLDHVASWAARHGGDAHRLLITGFCWGGRITWLYAAHNPQLKAAVAWYGKLVGEKSLNSPKHPVDIAVDLNARCLVCTALKTPAFRRTPSRLCVRRCGQPTPRRKSWSIPKPIMPLMPTIAPAIMKSQPKTAGSGCSPGLLSMAVKKANRPKHEKRRQMPPF